MTQVPDFCLVNHSGLAEFELARQLYETTRRSLTNP
jgi:hypothetical protein